MTVMIEMPVLTDSQIGACTQRPRPVDDRDR